MESIGSAFSGKLPDGLYAEIRTNRGKMTFLLDYDGTPLTVTNFINLSEGAIPGNNNDTPYYNELTVHKEIPNYAVFLGDPDGTGYGEPGYTLPREYNGNYSTGDPGALVMDGFPSEASGSRFFILEKGDPFLDSKYTAFGILVRGKVVLNALKTGDILHNITIVRKGEQVQALDTDRKAFNTLLQEARIKELETLRITNPLVANAVEELDDPRQKTLTGIFYSILREGEGPVPEPGDKVSVHYTGSLTDGTVFDSSLERDQPFTITLGIDSIIPGWIEMLTTMHPGELRKVVIPPYLAYGKQGNGPIPPDSWLIFEIELLNSTEG